MLEINGMRGVALEWIRSHLTNRKQLVEINSIETILF